MILKLFGLIIATIVFINAMVYIDLIPCKSAAAVFGPLVAYGHYCDQPKNNDPQIKKEEKDEGFGI